MRIQYRELLKDGQYLADPPPVGPVAKKWSYRFTEKIKPVKTLITVASMSNKGQYAILLIAALAMFMDGLDGSIVNVALPVISEDLGGDAGAVSWIVTVHLMVLAGLILIFGKISDRRVADTGLHRRILGVRVQLARPCKPHRLSFSYLEEHETELI